MVTIKDVARESGMSVTTVSRALNGYSDVNEGTREMIIKVAKNIGYVPNKAAQNLVKRENRTLAIIISGLEKNGGVDNIVYTLLSGMYSFAEHVGYEVMLFTTNSAYQREKSYVEFCKEHNIAGAVISGIRTDDPYFEELVETEFPCIMLDGLRSGDMNTISIDTELASFEITELMIRSGHKYIACMAGKREAEVTNDRIAGYKRALKEYNLEIDDNHTRYGDFTEKIAYEKTLNLMKENPNITAIVCQSDIMAIGVIRALNDLELSVPNDVSVVGFDNIPISQYMTPQLTTVDQNFYEMGREAAKQILSIIQNNSKGKKIILPHSIIIRNSIANI